MQTMSTVSTLLLSLVPFLASCADSTPEGDSTSTPGAEVADANHGHFLAVTIDGTRYEARGELFGPAVHYNGRQINIQVGGPLVSAVEAGEAVSLGDFDVKMNLYINSMEPGTYPLDYRRNKVSRGEEPLGFAELFMPKSIPFGKMQPVSGTITVASATGKEVGERYQILTTKGTITGQFKDDANAEHAVEIEFDYTR